MKTLMSALVDTVGARWKKYGALALTVSSLLVLAACGGGGGGGGSNRGPSEPPRPAETLFTGENAWVGDLPEEARIVTPDEFRRMHEAGELDVITSLDRNVDEQRRKRIEGEIEFLESLPDLSDSVKALIARARDTGDLDGQAVVTLPDGAQVGLIDLGSSIEMAAQHYRAARDPAVALRVYGLSYSLLTDELKEQVPTPESLQSASLEEIQEAASELNDALANVPGLDGTRLDPEAPVPPDEKGFANKAAGNGADNTGTCTQTGLARTYWFPLRAFVPPVQDQGRRGTCWAFAAIASVETRERVQNDNAIDLSEQYLINKVKHEWSPSDWVDGGSPAFALNAADERNHVLPPEAAWTYNLALSRPTNAFDTGVAGTPASYIGACANYTGFCSATAHQSPPVCTTPDNTSFCGYHIMAHVGPGTDPGSVSLIWSHGQPFNLNLYRALLAGGQSLLATFPVYHGFATASGGVVSDYSMKYVDATGNLVDGSYGDHVVQVIGFISNEDLSFPGSSPANIGGGGYFVIRNSWGCSRGDGGYWYVPADYVSSRFYAFEVLEFDGRRSQRWFDELRAPGGTSGLAVDPRGTTNVDLRVETDISGSFTVSHPIASYVRLTVTSDVDGPLFDGQWVVNQLKGGSLFGNTLRVNFQTEGLRTLTITARYGSQVVTATKRVIAVNTRPQLSFETLGTPQEGEPFVLTAVVTDKNEPTLTNICNAMEWTLEAPDEILSGSGCMRTVRFGVAGTRTVRVATQDSEGATASLVQTFDVAPPPENPYPRVTKAALYSSDRRDGGVFDLRCVWNEVPWETIIDLRQRACSMLIGDDTPRYLAEITIENPLAEALSYEWTLAGYYDGDVAPRRSYTVTTTTPSFEVRPMVFGGRDAANRCTIDVTVIAPEPSRNKKVRAWSGRCIQIEDAPK